MGGELLEIEPRELQFAFELKKQSSCSIHLTNKALEYVAFKVKTTSPKRYCVRPNVGVIPPLGACDFTVIMQAQKTAPPDMQLKDKFLVQATIVPPGTTTDDTTISAYFAKESGRNIEESKLKVVLFNATRSPVSSPRNGVILPGHAVEPLVVKEVRHNFSENPVTTEVSPVVFDDPVTPIKEMPAAPEELHVLTKESQLSPEDPSANINRTPILKDLLHANTMEPVEQEDGISHVSADVKKLRSTLNILETRLEEAEKVITKLREESKVTLEERDKLQNDVVALQRRSMPRSRRAAGFPLMFVVYMMLIGILIGYLLPL